MPPADARPAPRDSAAPPAASEGDTLDETIRARLPTAAPTPLSALPDELLRDRFPFPPRLLLRVLTTLPHRLPKTLPLSRQRRAWFDAAAFSGDAQLAGHACERLCQAATAHELPLLHALGIMLAQRPHADTPHTASMYTQVVLTLLRLIVQAHTRAPRPARRPATIPTDRPPALHTYGQGNPASPHPTTNQLVASLFAMIEAYPLPDKADDTEHIHPHALALACSECVMSLLAPQWHPPYASQVDDDGTDLLDELECLPERTAYISATLRVIMTNGVYFKRGQAHIVTLRRYAPLGSYWDQNGPAEPQPKMTAVAKQAIALLTTLLRDHTFLPPDRLRILGWLAGITEAYPELAPLARPNFPALIAASDAHEEWGGFCGHLFDACTKWIHGSRLADEDARSALQLFYEMQPEPQTLATITEVCTMTMVDRRDIWEEEASDVYQTVLAAQSYCTPKAERDDWCAYLFARAAASNFQLRQLELLFLKSCDPTHTAVTVGLCENILHAISVHDAEQAQAASAKLTAILCDHRLLPHAHLLALLCLLDPGCATCHFGRAARAINQSASHCKNPLVERALTHLISSPQGLAGDERACFLSQLETTDVRHLMEQKREEIPRWRISCATEAGKLRQKIRAQFDTTLFANPLHIDRILNKVGYT